MIGQIAIAPPKERAFARLRYLFRDTCTGAITLQNQRAIASHPTLTRY
jgi:hypothetical protein